MIYGHMCSWRQKRVDSTFLNRFAAPWHNMSSNSMRCRPAVSLRKARVSLQALWLTAAMWWELTGDQTEGNNKPEKDSLLIMNADSKHFVFIFILVFNPTLRLSHRKRTGSFLSLVFELDFAFLMLSVSIQVSNSFLLLNPIPKPFSRRRNNNNNHNLHSSAVIHMHFYSEWP